MPIDDTAELIVRDKTHAAAAMSTADALHEMELVGHDFFLYCDSEGGLPSVVYRRHGYDYGVIRLSTQHSDIPDQGTQQADTESSQARV